MRHGRRAFVNLAGSPARRIGVTPKDDECFERGTFPSLMLHWDGRAWRQVPMGQFGRINYVSASSPKDAWASADCALLHWDGRSWAAVPHAPIPGAQQVGNGAVKAVSATDAWLVGGTYDNTTGTMRGFVQRWNGRRWQNLSLPVLGDDFTLDSIDAHGPRDAWIVGTDYTGNDAQPESLILLHWNGRSWKRLPSPNTGEWTNRTTRVRMVSHDNVWVSGWSKQAPDGSQIRRPLLLHWNGRTWAGSPVPDGRGELMDIASSGGQTLAVGDTFTPTDPSYTMYVLRWGMGHWNSDPVPVAGMASMYGLAPSPGGMWGVGAIGGGQQQLKPFIARLK